MAADLAEKCQNPKYFEPDSRERAVQILTDFENARDRFTTESLEVPAIDASTLTLEERHDVAYSLAIRKTEDIAKKVMLWEDWLASSHRNGQEALG